MVETRYNSEDSGREDGVQPSPVPDQPTCKEVDVASPQSKRSPAFQFYPRDFLSSSKVDQMSMTERGIYITLLARCWLDNGLPADLGDLARMVRIPKARFERIWIRSQLSACFEQKQDRLINPRLEIERRVQTEYRRKQKEKADKRWSHDAAAMPGSATRHEPGNAPLSSSASSSAFAKEKKEISVEPLRDSTPTVLTFPTVGKCSTWVLTQGQIDGWIAAYPNLDVAAECFKAQAWIEANPERKKTAKGMSAFLVNWLNRATDRPRASSSVGPKATGPLSSAVSDPIQAWLNRKTAV